MATILKEERRYSDGRQWRVQIRRKGVCKNARFFTKYEAQKWAFEQEEMIMNRVTNSTPDLTVA
ncbi:hypothetical protein DPV83_04280 [Aggregatibacter segnis]|jgi:hypothetical protein|uniref:Integrase n=2 Tax=Aggregatibacter segnis TaxID=739 RepID=A0A8B2U7P3_9PAST|nr:hypothetical protein DPV83_04280 [Aggregatibacter segnis]